MAQRRVSTWTVLGTLGVAAVLAGCGSDGPSIGYHALTYAESDDLATACEDAFGAGEQVAARLGQEVDLQYSAEHSGEGMCAFTSEHDDVVGLLVTTSTPEGALVRAASGDFTVALFAVDSTGAAWPDVPEREKVKRWLTARAESVVDDHDAWLRTLPSLGAGWSSGPDGFDAEGLEPEDEPATLRTPWASVDVRPVTAPEHLVVEGARSRAGDGLRFVVVDVAVTPAAPTRQSGGTDTDTRRPGLAVLADGEPVDAADALDALDEDGRRLVALVVPDTAEDVRLAVTSGSATQRVSLLDGEVDDDGLGERLDDATSDSSGGEAESATATLPDGTTQRVGILGSYSDVADWSFSPWDDDAETFVDEGSASFTFTPQAVSPERALPLTAESVTLTTGGTQVPVASFDPPSLTYRFVVPADADQLTVTLATQPETGYLRGLWWWEDGSTTGTATQTWHIAPQLRD